MNLSTDLFVNESLATSCWSCVLPEIVLGVIFIVRMSVSAIVHFQEVKYDEAWYYSWRTSSEHHERHME